MKRLKTQNTVKKSMGNFLMLNQIYIKRTSNIMTDNIKMRDGPPQRGY